MLSSSVTEFQKTMRNGDTARAVLEQYDRSKILEIYFSRIDGRMPENIPEGYRDLYELELNVIKNFLLGQHPQDTILQNFFRIMN